MFVDTSMNEKMDNRNIEDVYIFHLDKTYKQFKKYKNETFKYFFAIFDTDELF